MGGLVDVFLKCCGKCCLVTLHICRIVSRIGKFVDICSYCYLFVYCKNFLFQESLTLVRVEGAS